METDVLVLIFVVECTPARATKFKGDEKMPNSKLHLVRLAFMLERFCQFMILCSLIVSIALTLFAGYCVSISIVDC